MRTVIRMEVLDTNQTHCAVAVCPTVQSSTLYGHLLSEICALCSSAARCDPRVLPVCYIQAPLKGVEKPILFRTLPRAWISVVPTFSSKAQGSGAVRITRQPPQSLVYSWRLTPSASGQTAAYMSALCANVFAYSVSWWNDSNMCLLAKCGVSKTFPACLRVCMCVVLPATSPLYILLYVYIYRRVIERWWSSCMRENTRRRAFYRSVCLSFEWFDQLQNTAFTSDV